MGEKVKIKVFYAETFVNIIIFSVVCLILSGVFLQALSLSQKLKEETFALTEIRYLLEVAKTGGLQEMEAAGKTSCFYDKAWNETDKSKAEFVIEVAGESSTSPAGELCVYYATAFRKDGSEIISLSASQYYPKVQGDAA